MGGRLEATEQAAGPTVAIIKGASCKGAAVVIKKVGRVVGITLEVGDGGGVPVACDLEGGAGAAGGVPFVRRSAGHGSPGGQRVR
jgi:hypothetical protein